MHRRLPLFVFALAACSVSGFDYAGLADQVSGALGDAAGALGEVDYAGLAGQVSNHASDAAKSMSEIDVASLAEKGLAGVKGVKEHAKTAADAARDGLRAANEKVSEHASKAANVASELGDVASKATKQAIIELLEPLSGPACVMLMVLCFWKVPFPLAIIICSNICLFGVAPTTAFVAKWMWWLTYSSADNPAVFICFITFIVIALPKLEAWLLHVCLRQLNFVPSWLLDPTGALHLDQENASNEMQTKVQAMDDKLEKLLDITQQLVCQMNELQETVLNQ